MAGEEGRGGARRRRPLHAVTLAHQQGGCRVGPVAIPSTGAPLSCDVETLTAGLRTLVESVYPGATDIHHAGYNIIIHRLRHAREPK